MKDLIVNNIDTLLLGLKHGLIIGFGAFGALLIILLLAEAIIRWRRK